jgi:acyl carrier protein phosphodiesterase
VNYVAHLLLTYPYDKISLGNLIGDMISNEELKTLSESVRKGVQIHRAIDHHTDNHSSMREVVRLLRPQHRKYAPVVADILLDHVLVLNWGEHSNIDFPDFEKWVYDMIAANFRATPVRIHNQLKGMAQHRWLNQYANLEGLQHVLDRMDRRARFPSDFGLAINDFHEHYTAMQNAIQVLLTDLSKVVLKMC